MDERSKRLLDGIERHHRGIEIAPWFNPLVPKSEGYDVLVADVFDRPTLMERAIADPAISEASYAKLEEVDLVGSATELATLVPQDDHGSFDYIVSSHNFEHLPNPIKFLQACERLLKPGGILSMAIPDARTCFDYFRPHTVISDWLEAFLEDRAKPALKTVFELEACSARAVFEHGEQGAFSLWNDGKLEIVTRSDLRAAYEKWRTTPADAAYQDAHCTVMTPASFELLIEECRYLGLTRLQAQSISDPVGCEFYARLARHDSDASAVPVEEMNTSRTALMHRILAERTPVSLIEQLAGELASGSLTDGHAVPGLGGAETTAARQIALEIELATYKRRYAKALRDPIPHLFTAFGEKIRRGLAKRRSR